MCYVQHNNRAPILDGRVQGKLMQILVSVSVQGIRKAFDKIVVIVNWKPPLIQVLTCGGYCFFNVYLKVYKYVYCT